MPSKGLAICIHQGKENRLEIPLLGMNVQRSLRENERKKGFKRPIPDQTLKIVHPLMGKCPNRRSLRPESLPPTQGTFEELQEKHSAGSMELGQEEGSQNSIYTI